MHYIRDPDHPKQDKETPNNRAQEYVAMEASYTASEAHQSRIWLQQLMAAAKP